MLTGEVGQWSLHVLLATIVLSIVLHMLAALKKRSIWKRFSKIAMLVQFACALLASMALFRLLITGNFHFPYVADYTGQGLPLIYRIAAFWGGNAGSLLLWALVLTLYGAVVSMSRHEDSERMLPWVRLFISGVTLFYALLLQFSANPFVYSNALVPPNGLNPLLQNPGMTVHPVNVYLGYIGFTVTFAYAMTGLILKKTDATWLRVTRRWTLISWLFLSIGIVYGAHWSYEELGWGGYWAWDPVENASLLPWLTATAFLHSAIVQEKRGMLKGWNVILISLTFVLTLLGTFLTRSGVLWSIHAFANAPLGAAFLLFLGIVTVVSAVLILWRWPSLAADRQIEAVVSKEAGFLLNNVLFLSSMFAVLWGTIFPILSESLAGHRMMVSGPFYNQVNLPIAVCIMLLMGVGPLVAWRRASLKSVLASIILPFGVSVGIGLSAAGVLQYTYHRTSVLATSALIGAAFVILTVFVEFVRSVQARVALTSEHFAVSFVQLIIKNRRRYGGYIVHLGIAVMAIGIAGSGAYHVDVQQQLSPGQSATIGDYSIAFDGMGVGTTPDGRQLYANLIVSRGGQQLGVMRPSATFYTNGQQPSTNVSLYSGPTQDLYIVMLGTSGTSQAVFDMHVNPLVQFIWFGGYLFIAGTLVSLWPERRRVLGKGRSYAAIHLYEDLAELEYDYRTGKMDDEAYSESKQKFLRQIRDTEQYEESLRQRILQELDSNLNKTKPPFVVSKEGPSDV